MAVRPIPDGYHTITPFIVAHDTAKLVDFIQKAFGAEEIERMAAPDGTVMHAELRIGDSMIMLGEAQGEWKAMPATLYLYVKDVDATFARAVSAGATTVKEVADQFYGDRNGTVKDAWGNFWSVATHVEDVSPEEMKRRVRAAMQERG
jgi:PhnB protein